MSIAFRAMEFAREAHAYQKRKYTGNPYSDHLAEVAGITAAAMTGHDFIEPAIAAAWLHDCVEDQGVERGALVALFGDRVADAVMLLSDLETGNRAERKAASRARLSRAAGWVQTIKVADLISNTSSIVQHDPKFAEVYLVEKRLMLDVLTSAHPSLRRLAYQQIGGAA